jgi:NAD(P)-dependent dehydrogenase (short-subunit alcohol dehydrogenase family)
MIESASSVMDRFRLDGRQALVTGAAHGIGRATAAALAQAGASVWLADIDGVAVAEAAGQLAAGGLRASAKTLDVTDDEAARRIVDDIVAATGRLDVLVNNAGIGGRAPSVTYERELWERVVAVNLTGCFLMARTAARAMLPRQSGCVVNVASIMGVVGNGLYPNPAYHATKGALVNLTRALAIEWAPQRLRVNAVAPCFVETPLTTKLLADPAMKTEIVRRTPLGRLAAPEDVAAAIVFLASDAAAMVTGHVLAVDGGWLAQ